MIKFLKENYGNRASSKPLIFSLISLLSLVNENERLELQLLRKELAKMKEGGVKFVN